MSFYGGGDDALIRRLYAAVTILVIVCILLVIYSGIVQFVPFTREDFSCVNNYHPLITLRYAQLEEPVLPRQCHG